MDLSGSGFGGTTSLNLFDFLPPEVKNMIIGAILLTIALYVYLSMVHMKIGKKASLQNPGVAWISPIITLFEAAKMHWWPWAMIFIGYLVCFLLGLFNSTSDFGKYLMLAVAVIFLVMMVVWQWKTFKAVNKPGWWALVLPIALVLSLLLLTAGPGFALAGGIIALLGFVVYLILIGIAAWSKK